MNKHLTTILSLVFCCLSLSAAPAKTDKQQPKDNEVKETNYEYNVIVYEHPSDHPFRQQAEAMSTASQRGVFSALLDVYRSTFAGKIVNFSAQVLSAGVNLIVKAASQEQENYQRWQQITNSELRFRKALPTKTEITDFYQAPSHIGAMDPDGIIFKGLGCKQSVTYMTDSGIVRIPVLEVVLSMDTTMNGQQRMCNHGKFQLIVDSIIFNPFLCNLPNDSLTAQQVRQNMRIPFDFRRRTDLSCRLQIDISSSWMNEAIQIVNDQPLGSFTVEFTIPDSTLLDTEGRWKGYYTWFADRDKRNPRKRVSVTGESFVVPRSFISTQQQGSALISTWGTGQYRVQMSLEESCRINRSYYYNGKEPNGKWKEEWKQMRRRRHYPGFWDEVKTDFLRTFDIQHHQWIHTLLDPIQSAIIVSEQRWINTLLKVETPVNTPTANTKSNNGQPNNQTTNAGGSQTPQGQQGQAGPTGTEGPRGK